MFSNRAWYAAEEPLAQDRIRIVRRQAEMAFRDSDPGARTHGRDCSSQFTDTFLYDMRQFKKFVLGALWLFLVSQSRENGVRPFRALAQHVNSNQIQILRRLASTDHLPTTPIRAPGLPTNQLNRAALRRLFAIGIEPRVNQRDNFVDHRVT